MRVIINGEGYDLMGAYRDATMSDWKSLIAQTGRGSAAVKRGLDAFGEVHKTPGDTPAAVEEIIIDTLTDLVYLARRTAGERPLSHESVADSLPYFGVMQALNEAGERMRAAAEAKATADPT